MSSIPCRSRDKRDFNPLQKQGHVGIQYDFNEISMGIQEEFNSLQKQGQVSCKSRGVSHAGACGSADGQEIDFSILAARGS